MTKESNKTPLTYLITGTSRGIGLELSRQTLASGHSVVAIARAPEHSSSLQALATKHPERLSIIKADVTSGEQVDAITASLGRHTAIDVLINNAGVYGGGESFKKLSLEDVAATILTNAVAPMRVTRALLPLLERSQRPKVAHITSLMGSIEDNSSGGSYGYRMSKAALNMFHKSFAVDHPRIVSLAIHPGWVKTDMGGANAPTSPAESARGILALIKKANAEDSGKFYDFEGGVLPW